MDTNTIAGVVKGAAALLAADAVAIPASSALTFGVADVVVDHVLVGGSAAVLQRHQLLQPCEMVMHDCYCMHSAEWIT